MTVYPLLKISDNCYLTRIGPYLVMNVRYSTRMMVGESDTIFWPVSEFDGPTMGRWRSFGNSALNHALFFGKELDTNASVPFEELVLPGAPLSHSDQAQNTKIHKTLLWLASL